MGDCDLTVGRPVAAVHAFGFTERQALSLLLVLEHSSVPAWRSAVSPQLDAM